MNQRSNISALIYEICDSVIHHHCKKFFPSLQVFYEALLSNAGLKARWWSTKSPRKNFADSYTQTGLTVEQMIIRSMEPDILQYLQKKIPNIIELAKNL